MWHFGLSFAKSSPLQKKSLRCANIGLGGTAPPRLLFLESDIAILTQFFEFLRNFVVYCLLFRVFRSILSVCL